MNWQWNMASSFLLTIWFSGTIAGRGKLSSVVGGGTQETDYLPLAFLAQPPAMYFSSKGTGRQEQENQNVDCMPPGSHLTRMQCSSESGGTSGSPKEKLTELYLQRFQAISSVHHMQFLTFPMYLGGTALLQRMALVRQLFSSERLACFSFRH